MDITFAGYVFALLVFIKILFSFWGSGLRVMSAVMTFVEFSLIVIPIASILYFLNYGRYYYNVRPAYCTSTELILMRPKNIYYKI